MIVDLKSLHWPILADGFERAVNTNMVRALQVNQLLSCDPDRTTQSDVTMA